MDLEDPNGVSEGDIGLPTPLDDRRRDSTWSEEFLWLDMSYEVAGLKRSCCSLSRFSMSRNHYLKTFKSGFHSRISL